VGGLPDHLYTGNSELDSQHAGLFARIELFRDKTKTAGDPVEMKSFLDYLHDYTVMHFRFEENLMRELHYPATWEHEAEHQKFWREVLGLLDACAKMKYCEMCGQKVYNTVAKWLWSHIEKEDRALAEWIRLRSEWVD
jgi:hemerythrin